MEVITPVNIDERKNLDIRTGDTVRLSLRIQEKGKTRLQPYEGLVIAIKGGKEAGAMITVRRVASGVGMEKTMPLYSPTIAKIEIVNRAKTRRSKLYYIREKAARAARRKIKNIFGFERTMVADETVERPSEAPADAENTEATNESAPEVTENTSAEETTQEEKA